MEEKFTQNINNLPSRISLLTGLSIISVILILFLAYSFYTALSENLMDTRRGFLNKQVELASNDMQRRFSSLEDDLIFYANTIDDGAEKNRDNEQILFGENRVRRLLNNYLHLVDTLFVQNGEVYVLFYLRDNNYFAKETRSNKFTEINCSDCLLVGSNKGRVKIIAQLSLGNFFEELLGNYFIGEDALKFYFENGKIKPIPLSGKSSRGISLDNNTLQEIKKDIKGGLRGEYEGLLSSENNVTAHAVIVQYPFQLIPEGTDYAFLFAQESRTIISGIYGTYFYLFGAIFSLLGFILLLMFKFFGSMNLNQKLLEKKSEDINQLFRQQTLLMQQSKGFIYYHNNHGRIYKVSENLIDVLGYTQEEFINVSKEILLPGELERIQILAKESIEQKLEFFYYETEVRKKDGNQIKTKSFEKLIYSEQGEFIGSVGICTDIHEKYLAEQELIKSENRLRLVLNSLPDIIFIYNHQGDYVDYYVQDIDQLIEPPHQSIGKNIMEVLPYPDNQKTMQTFNKAVRTGKIQAQELELMLSSGRRFFEVKFFKLDEEKVISIARDITGQKLWEKGLKEAKEAAEATSREKTEFLTNMSHEIRTPLNGLIGIIGLLYRTSLSGQQKKYLDILSDSGNSLLHIVNDILDYSKIEAGKYELNPVLFDFRAEMEKFVNIFDALLTEKNILLEKIISAKMPQFVLLDKDKLYQILFNILGNAIKFTPKGGEIKISISTEFVFSNNLMITFSIKDNGIGVPKDKIKYLTQPFVQVENKEFRNEKGTGLGLAIASKLIELMGGFLQIESEVGFGSDFSFTIVSQIPEVIKINEVQIPDDEINYDDLARDYPVKILLVEDNDINLQFMTMLLHQMGYNPDISKNGEEAVEKVNKNLYNLIFMDNQMPKLNGIEATKIIRRSKNGKKPYIIGLSANVFADHIDEAFKSGMNEYLTKPVKIKEIVAGIKKCFQQMIIEK